MKRVVAWLVLALAARAVAAAELKPVEMMTRETTSVALFGITAAWSLEPSIADASATDGNVTIYARGAGHTKVIAVTMAGQQTIDVTVKPRVVRSNGAAGASGDAGVVQAQYSTGSRQLQNELTLRKEDGGRVSSLQLHTVTNVASQATANDRVATPSVSYTTAKNGRAVTLFDQQQSLSPLTLDRIALRGVHVETRDWELHGGVTALATFQSFLLPTDRQFVVTAARHFSFASGIVTPAVIAIDARHGSREAIASLGYETPAGAPAAISAELAWNHGLGGSIRAHWRGGENELDATLLHRPREFAVAGPAQHGTFGDAAWHLAHGNVTADARGSISRFDELHNRQAIDTGSLDLRYRITDAITAIGGGSLNSLESGALHVRSVVVPVGISIDGRRTGASATVRYASNSRDDEGGFGGRLTARASFGRFFTSAYVDVQQQAPTLTLIYRDVPELEAALEQLGIEATTPADIARALRENAVLQQLGILESSTIDLAPMRMQAGWDLAWFGGGESRRQLRMRLLVNRVERVSSMTQTVGASLSYSQRLSDATDIFATISEWRTQVNHAPARVLPSFDLGVRHRFDGLDGLFDRGGAISGLVFADEELTGEPENARGVAGAEVELDGKARQKTGADGRFAFTGVRGGSHRVVVRTPEMKDAYFTTPATVEASRGEVVNFGVATTPARLFGTVSSDAGRGVGGVRLVLKRGTRSLTATTLSDGAFSFVATPGEWELELMVDSIPAGYLIEGAGMRTVMLDRATPLEVKFALKTNRSISGKVLAAQLPATITIRETGRKITTTAGGEYSLRGLPSGSVTLQVAAGGAEWTRAVALPQEPAMIRNVDFGIADVAPATNGGTREITVVADSGFFVQLGAYRVEANARETAQRAEASGAPATIVNTKNLILVRVGPYASAALAERTAARLQDAGLDAVVLHVR